MGFLKYFVAGTNTFFKFSVLKEHYDLSPENERPKALLNTVNHSFWFNERLLFTLHSMLVQKQWFHILKLVLQLQFWLLLEKCTHTILWLSEGCCQWAVIFSSPIMMELHKECSTECCISLLPRPFFHQHRAHPASFSPSCFFLSFCELTRVWEAQYTGEYR